jgi:hypothetical protein
MHKHGLDFTQKISHLWCVKMKIFHEKLHSYIFNLFLHIIDIMQKLYNQKLYNQNTTHLWIENMNDIL